MTNDVYNQIVEIFTWIVITVFAFIFGRSQGREDEQRRIQGGIIFYFRLEKESLRDPSDVYLFLLPFLIWFQFLIYYFLLTCFDYVSLNRNCRLLLNRIN